MAAPALKAGEDRNRERYEGVENAYWVAPTLCGVGEDRNRPFSARRQIGIGRAAPTPGSVLDRNHMIGPIIGADL